MANYTKQKVNAQSPICSTSLPTGERVQIVAPPACDLGLYSITIRKPSNKTFGLDELDAGGLFEHTRAAKGRSAAGDAELLELKNAGKWPAFLELAVKARKNILISGATGSGKTTLSKALIQLIPSEERLLTIEDTRELIVPHRNAVHMLYSKDGQGQANIGAKHLLEASLRMRPDRILLQELRDGTAFFYLRNVNSGHPGSITTVHADSAALAFGQLSLLVKESEGGRDLDRGDILALLKLLVDVVVQCKKVDGRFRVTEIYFEPELIES
jgi:type IV secretion system protein VirB11